MRRRAPSRRAAPGSASATSAITIPPAPGSPSSTARSSGSRSRSCARASGGCRSSASSRGCRARASAGRCWTGALRAADGCRGAIILSSSDPRAMRRYFRAGFRVRPCLGGGRQRQPLTDPGRAGRAAGRPRAATARRSTPPRATCAARRTPRTSAALLATGHQLLVIPTAAAGPRRATDAPAIVAAFDEAAATDLRGRLWPPARPARPSTSTSSRQGNDWAVAVALDARPVAHARRPDLRARRARPARALPAQRRLPMRLRGATRADIPVIVALVRRCDETVPRMGRPGGADPARGGRGAGVGAALRRAAARGSGWREDEDGTIAGVIAFAAGQASREDRTLVPGLAHVNAVFVDPATGGAGSLASSWMPPTRRCAPPAMTARSCGRWRARPPSSSTRRSAGPATGAATSIPRWGWRSWPTSRRSDGRRPARAPRA